MKKAAFVALLAILAVVVSPSVAYAKFGQIRIYYSEPALINEVGIKTITYGWFNCTDYGLRTPYYVNDASHYCY